MSSASLIAGAIGMLGSSAQKKKQDRLAKQMAESAQVASNKLMGFATPLLNQANKGITNYADLLFNQIGSQVGKESAILKAQHGTNLTNINRNKEGALANSLMNWQATGNAGRGRGEAIRINQNATEAANAENLGYGIGQQNYKDATVDRFASGLGNLTQMGLQGLSPAMAAVSTLNQGKQNAIAMQSQASGDMYNDIGSLVGTIYGDYEAKQNNKQQLDMLKKIFGK